MYFCKTPRIYVLTRQERDSGVYVCPYCGKTLKKGNLSKSEKLFTCASCRFKITGRDILQEYPNQKVVVDIGIELQKVAKIITSSKEEKDPFGFTKEKAHQIFEKAKKVNNNVLQWAITTEKQNENYYKFNAYPQKESDESVIAIEVERGNNKFLGGNIPFLAFAISIRLGDKAFNLQTQNVNSVKELFDKILRTDFSKLLSINSNRLKDIKDFIKNRFNLTPDEEDSDILIYATRAHGDVGNETPGKEDIQLIKKVMSEVKAKFKNLVLRPEIVDEWVQLEIELED